MDSRDRFRGRRFALPPAIKVAGLGQIAPFADRGQGGDGKWRDEVTALTNDFGNPRTDPDEPPARFPPLLTASAWRRAANRYGWTAREAQIAVALCLGWSYVRTRTRLRIQHSTLRTHLKSLYRKASCRGRVELILTLVHDFR